MRRNFPHRHICVCENCKRRWSYEHDRMHCDLPRTIYLDKCVRCIPGDPQQRLTAYINYAVEKERV
jgi:hypothetical protein